MIKRPVFQYSLAFLLEWVAASISGLPDVRQTDLLILLAVLGENLRHLNDDPATLYRVCFGDHLTPAERQRGTSRSIIARFLNLPFETVRRRIDVLLKFGRLQERSDGLICTAYVSDPSGHVANAKRRNADQVALLYNLIEASDFEVPPAEWIVRSGHREFARADPAWICPLTSLSVEYALLMISEAMHAFDVSFPHLLVLLTILHHNTTYLADGRHGSGTGGIAPDRMRRGISYAGVMRSVVMPWATVRRRILDLISQELVDRTASGVIVPARVVQRYICDTHLALHNNKYLTRLFANLDSLSEYKRRASGRID